MSEQLSKVTKMTEGDLATWARVTAIKKAAEDKKAEDIEVFDLRTFSVVSEYFVVMTTLSPPHANAVAEEIQTSLDGLLHIERDRGDTWILMDYGDVVVHIFQPESRKYYSLERLWGDMSVVPKKPRKSTRSIKSIKSKKKNTKVRVNKIMKGVAVKKRSAPMGKGKKKKR